VSLGKMRKISFETLIRCRLTLFPSILPRIEMIAQAKDLSRLSLDAEKPNKWCLPRNSGMAR
ncbi:MAG: hypothetical protein ABGX22_14150, partial [Pirellulaceae bacterium]